MQENRSAEELLDRRANEQAVDGLKPDVDEVEERAAQEGAGQAVQLARERPLPVAVAGGFAAGFLIGWLLRGR